MMIEPRTDEHPLAVLGCFLAVGLHLMVMVMWGHDPFRCGVYPSCDHELPTGGTRGESNCRDDYAPVAPRDGAWCGVRLDDRYPLRDDSFPTIEIDR